MKRTLCLLMAVFLLVGVMAPAAMAQSDGDIQIICRNWSWDIPVTEFQFEYTMEGATLSEEPCFLYEDENGNLQRETGTLRDIPYVLKFFFQLDDSFPRDYNFVSLNRNCADTKTIAPDGNGGWRMEVQFRVPVYERISVISVGPGAKPRPGESIGTGSICTGGVDCSLTVLQGDTPDAPEVDTWEEHSFEVGQTYLFRFDIRAKLNVDLTDDFKVEIKLPLQYCPELTQPDPRGIPDSYTIYARYDCADYQPLEIVDGPDGKVWYHKDEHNDAGEVLPNTPVTVRFENTKLPYEYDFVKWDIQGLTLPEEQLYQQEIEFLMPDHPVKITPVLERYVFPYTDVDQDDWFYDGVYLADQVGLTEGVTDTQFGPYQTCTRAQFTTHLVRLYEGEEEAPTEFERENPFTDVKEGDWYYGYVRTAYDLGLVSGKTATTFEPNAPISRAEMVTMLWRLAGEETLEDEACPFTDVYRNTYYYDAVVWASAGGIVQGVSPTSFAPYRDATRAEGLTILLRLFFT